MVSWDAPANDGMAVLTGYTVQWKSGDQDYDDSRQHRVGADATEYTITGLANDVEYTVRVFAHNLFGDESAPPVMSIASAEVTGTPLVVPDAPAVTITAGDGELAVNWAAPEAYGTEITDYTVQWKSGDEDYASSRQATVTADVTGHTIGGLDNGVEYTVQVRATNANGSGPWSSDSTATPEAAPPVVETKTVDRVVYRTRSAPAPAPMPAGPSIIGDSGYATTYLAVDGQSIELRIQPQAGGPASHTFAIGSFIRDADLGQTYQIVAGGKRPLDCAEQPAGLSGALGGRERYVYLPVDGRGCHPARRVQTRHKASWCAG